LSLIIKIDILLVSPIPPTAWLDEDPLSKARLVKYFLIFSYHEAQRVGFYKEKGERERGGR